MKTKLIILFIIISGSIKAQESLQYFRNNDKSGLNIFETSKTDTTSFTGLKVKVGGNFTQDYQALNHSNNASVVNVAGKNANQLIGLTHGFNLAMANLNIDVQLADGIRLNLTSYLSTRHHSETWVKAGYIQFDKLLFLNSKVVNTLMNNITLKVGDLEVDYGDQHFRRSDGGNTMFNPFAENYIMDEFATEVGGEVYYHTKNGFLAMLGVTDGELRPVVTSSTTADTATGKLNTYAAAFHGKIGYDKQVNSDLRIRLTGSFYSDKSAAGNSLFFGDRAGSHYFFVMENTVATSDGNAWSGRYNPSFSEQVNTFMINPFVKYKGIELFGTYEAAKGRKITEPGMRKATQSAVDVIYRFGKKENYWIGGRYNNVEAQLPGATNDVNISRTVASAGWFLTKNILLKGEYVSQVYKNFDPTDIRSGGKFNGVVVEAVVGF